MRYRCAYIYPLSTDRCVYTGCEEEGDMCPAHNQFGAAERKKAAKRVHAERKYADHKEGSSPDKTLPGVRRPRKNGPVVVQPSRVQSAKEIIEKLPPAIGAPEDPSAPYCTCIGRSADSAPCNSCGKPHFIDWREAVSRRKKEKS